MTARTSFDHELELLKIDLVKMGSMVEEAIENSIQAFRTHDNSLARIVVENDVLINDIEKQIETKCLNLILRQQPVARDLRFISTALKIITDMERIGDQAEDIAQLSIEITGEHIYEFVAHIPKMADIVIRMVHDSITSFVNNDLILAEEVINTDDKVDCLFRKVKEDLSDILKNDNDAHHNTIDFLMIAKYLERIADHAVNICEWVRFSQTGEHKDKRFCRKGSPKD